MNRAGGEVNDTLSNGHPDGPRPAGARGNIRNAFPYGTANVPFCPFRAQGMWVVRVPRVPLATLALPWARFLLPLWGVLVQLCCPCCLCCPGCRLYFLHSAHEHIGCLRMGVNGNKDGFLKKPPFYSSKKSFGKSPTFPTPIPQSSCIYWRLRV